ncbi:hypothetical protein CDO46_20240 [Pigmentiphaga sp. NML030171]|jgi:DNA-binding transcriptional regulator YiaG|uniref:HTH cro/C1-type domain-containing protein n=1 Tax=Pigmentiphaga daeguensis TaxID=414049 RepID=A0ABN1CFY9_9BURK|nr:hypothetical protein CDO46_20240 [Pigmentiphaga sp. NML030171]
MESGLIDADLGGFLYKKRVARLGSGKSGGYRTLLSARLGRRYVFLHGFPKSDKADITQGEKKALQFVGKVFLELSPVREFEAADIKHLREALKFSQPVFALHLHTTASTVRKWEQGETRPAGPALKLLNIIADKGLQAIL